MNPCIPAPVSACACLCRSVSHFFSPALDLSHVPSRSLSLLRVLFHHPSRALTLSHTCFLPRGLALDRSLARSRSRSRSLSLALACSLSPFLSQTRFFPACPFSLALSFSPILSLLFQTLPLPPLLYPTTPLCRCPPPSLFLMFLLLCNNIYTLSGLDPKTTTIFTKPPTELAQTNLHAKPPPQDSCKRIPLRPATHIHSHTRTI